MKQRSMLICIMLLCSLYVTTLQGQEVIPVTGGNATGGGGSVSYTVGQITYLTLSGTNGTVAQGVQQPFEISVITAIEQAKDITLVCSVYPNPASDFLTLKVENYDKENLSYILFDASGKLLVSKKVTGNVTIISMANLLPSLYFLKVIDNQKEIKTFKIIKN
ncbi:MAG: T9SS C-terminal target domain-containing protein [Ignavibacteriales bacterium]|nr:MAG: T9SS C-terminal target domain-containing protein [Ignavibacteriales bacterium]